MNKISKFKMAAKSALISAVAVPAMGIAAHFVNGGTFALNDATLSERFECAYTLNPENNTYVSYEYRAPDDYRYYEDETGQRRFIGDYGDLFYSESWIEEGGKYDKICVPEKYLAHPFVIYPMHFLIAGLAYAGMRRRQKNMAQTNVNKKTR